MPAEHLITLATPAQLPDLIRNGHLHGRPEPRIAMVGRSNVGKSSLINAMLKFKGARTSAEPGKTRQIHFYTWPERKRIVADLPGYGFAKAGAKERRAWAKLIESYLHADERLDQVLLLLDSRNGPTPLDAEAIEFLSSQGIPVTFVFTKADKLKKQSERVKRRREALGRLAEFTGTGPGEIEPAVFWTSAASGLGIKELVRSISD